MIDQIKSDLAAELAALKSDPALETFDACKKVFDAATVRMDKAVQAAREFGKSDAVNVITDPQELGRAESAILKARLEFEIATNDARAIRSRIAEVDRILSAEDRIAESNATIATLRAELVLAANNQNLTEAAIAKLGTMQADAQARLTGFAQASADQLLIDLGMPGESITQPKSTEVTKTQQELAALGIAIAKATTSHEEQVTVTGRIERDMRAAQDVLMDATADSLAVQHAHALGVYLPHLAALRNAEMCARGYITQRVDVEALATAMNQAAQQTQ